jgi:MFS family permease
VVSLLKNAGFRRLWISQIVLAAGGALMQMGLLEVFRTHGYDVRVETAKFSFALALPGLVLGPFAIAWLDRWQRRGVLIISDGIRAVLVAGVVVWLLPLITGRIEQRSLLAVYIVVGVIGAIATFYLPARSALLPNLVAPGYLMKANALFAASLAIATIGGSAVGGFVAERIGVTWAVSANAAMYIVSVIFLWRIRVDPHATASTMTGIRNSGWNEFRTGMTYLWEHPSALPLVILSGVFAFLLGILVVVFVGYAMKTLGLQTAGVGYLVAAGGIGAGAGIGLLGHGKPWTHSDWLPFVQLLLAAGALICLSAITNAWLAAPVVVVLGAVAATVLIYIDAKLQAQVEDARRGAVFAARGAVTSATMCVAFGLQIWTSVLRQTPAPTVLLWLGEGSIAAALLTVAMFLARRRQAR